MSENFVPAPDVTDDDKLWSLLSYIISPIVPVIVLLLDDKKNREFIRYHAIQSLVIGIVAWVLTFALSFILVGFCVGIAFLGYAIYLGIKAYAGEKVVIPVVTDFCIKQGWIQ
ncbi:MAG: DUF4870 domain-containing protein [Anaerolineae bacterium]|nr:DUF4870 domain-containing protein [Anaerolineae bacterium]